MPVETAPPMWPVCRTNVGVVNHPRAQVQCIFGTTLIQTYCFRRTSYWLVSETYLQKPDRFQLKIKTGYLKGYLRDRYLKSLRKLTLKNRAPNMVHHGRFHRFCLLSLFYVDRLPRPELQALKILLTKKEFLEAERCFESVFKNFDADRHERPTSLANFGFLATSSHVVVVRDINIENQLAKCSSLIQNQHFTSRCSSLKSGDNRCLQL